ncbi:MAG: O-antigen ligase family protein [Armatimonadota bacterium]
MLNGSKFNLLPKQSLPYLRRSAALVWRKFWRALIIISGLLLFVGAQLLLARGINNWSSYWYLIILAGVAILSIIIAAKNSAFMLATWLVLVPWTWYFPLKPHKYYLQFDLLIMALLTMIAIPKFLVYRQKIARPTITEILLILSVLWCNVWPLIRLGTGSAKPHAAILQLILVPGIIYFLAKVTLENEKQIKLMIGAICVIGLLWTVSGFYEHYTGYQWHSAITGNPVLLKWQDVARGRAVGPSDSQVAPGTVLCAGLLAFLHVMSFVKKKWILVCGYIVVACISIAVFFTYTRTSYGGYAVGLIVAFLISKGRRRQYSIMLTAIAIIALFTIPKLMLDPEFNVRMSDPENYYGRVAMTRTLINMIDDNFWLGIGDFRNENYTAVMEKYVSSWEHPRLGEDKKLAFPDNNYLLVFAVNGVFGFIFHFGAILAFIVAISRLRNELPTEGLLGHNLASVTLAYSAVVLIAMTVTQLQSQPYLYYLMFVMYAMVFRAKELQDTKQSQSADTVSVPALAEAAKQES